MNTVKDLRFLASKLFWFVVSERPEEEVKRKLQRGIQRLAYELRQELRLSKDTAVSHIRQSRRLPRRTQEKYDQLRWFYHSCQVQATERRLRDWLTPKFLFN